MSLRTVQAQPLGTNQGKITVEGDTIEEVMGTKAKEHALLAARSDLGMFRAGISGASGPWPVDEQGNDCTLQASPDMRYRNEFSIHAGLGV